MRCVGVLRAPPPYASEMAAPIVNGRPAAALVDRPVTSDIPRDDCVGHVLQKLPVPGRLFHV
jgi:hypothetical protein